MSLLYKIENSSSIYDPDYIKGLFHTMSVSYERMNYVASFGFSYRWRTQFLKKITIPRPDIKILDLMSGMGETWVPIKKLFPHSELTALDFCEGMVNRSKKKNSLKFNDTISIIQKDVFNNGLAENSFDAIVCCFGLKTFNELQITKLAQEVKRLLKQGGQFSFIEISVPKNPLFRSMYTFYVKYLIPVFGRIMLGNPKEYRMLWEYTSRYVNAEKTTEIFAAAGLHTKQERYCFGCASGVSGHKQ